MGEPRDGDEQDRAECQANDAEGREHEDLPALEVRTLGIVEERGELLVDRDHGQQLRLLMGLVQVWATTANAMLLQVLNAKLEKVPSTTLADLFTLLFAANPFSAARASLWRWSSDEFEDALAHGGQCRSRRRPVDSFFPALLF